MRRRSAVVLFSGLGLLVLAAVVGAATLSGSAARQGGALGANPYLDPGTPLSRPAPDFTLTDQFGEPISLRDFRGRVVLLAFVDSQCTTVCPLTTVSMLDAKAMLGPAASRVQLLGVDANPTAIAVRDVRAYSAVHGMMRRWHFLTGSLTELKHVWKRYGIEAQIVRGQIDHTPALYAIDPEGRLRMVYLTQMAYAGVAQQAQILARELARLVPGHPRVRSRLSYAPIESIPPSRTVSLPRAGGGRVRLGPGGAPRLYLFFATWDAETSDLRAELEALDRYQSLAAAAGLPRLTAVDEGSVEPSPGALTRFLDGLRDPLSYPVAIDASGRVADGYEVQDEPWFVLISPAGLIMWYYDVSTQGWLNPAALARHVRAALGYVAPVGAASGVLAGSPPPLAALHAQAGQLLGSSSALAARLRALRGYPVVLNAWASWCDACRSEFPLFASAALRFGRRVAFLGVDLQDSPGDARSFLGQHPVSYPSYQSTPTQLASLASVAGLPTTIFIDPAGKVVHVQTGQYDAQSSLDGDIEQYALGG